MTAQDVSPGRSEAAHESDALDPTSAAILDALERGESFMDFSEPGWKELLACLQDETSEELERPALWPRGSNQWRLFRNAVETRVEIELRRRGRAGKRGGSATLRGSASSGRGHRVSGKGRHASRGATVVERVDPERARRVLSLMKT